MSFDSQYRCFLNTAIIAIPVSVVLGGLAVDYFN